MSPTSLPIVPTEPAASSYPVSALNLFPTYTRDTYLAAFGVQAPAWDNSRPTKAWFDTSPGAGSYKVIGIGPDGTWGEQPLTLPESVAASVNLAGVYTYPAYVIAPTSATVNGTGINPMFLSLESDARALMSLFPGSTLADESLSPAFQAAYPAGELRRVWALSINGTEYNVGVMLNQQNAQGVGTSGKWTLDTVRGPEWVADPPAPTGIGDTRPPVPVPVRDLLPNEKVVSSLFGGLSITKTSSAAPTDRQFLESLVQQITAHLNG